MHSTGEMTHRFLPKTKCQKKGIQGLVFHIKFIIPNTPPSVITLSRVLTNKIQIPVFIVK